MQARQLSCDMRMFERRVRKRTSHGGVDLSEANVARARRGAERGAAGQEGGGGGGDLGGALGEPGPHVGSQGGRLRGSEQTRTGEETGLVLVVSHPSRGTAATCKPKTQRPGGLSSPEEARACWRVLPASVSTVPPRGEGSGYQRLAPPPSEPPLWQLQAGAWRLR